MTAARWIALALAVAIGGTAIVFALDMSRAYARIEGHGTVIATPFGELHYTDRGSGPAVLVVHGSGGGHDQGELIAESVLGERFRTIAPSRFGYLRSTVKPGATFDDQAQVYAHLLDHLGIRRVAVVALSHGGPSALLFAARHPERVSALVLISCGVASAADATQAQASDKGNALTTIFRHDVLYWALSTLGRKPLMRLMGASDEVIAGLTPAQRALVDRVIDEMNPVAPRAAGVAFDNTAALPNQRIAAIRAPTLILHAADDELQLFRNAEYAAAHIPGARLQRFERGGHLLFAVEQPALRAATTAFVLEHAR